jgi:2'-hydroxyisoflavone reductase
MNILIIGGTKFLGRHLVDSALEHGHEITLFNRGKTNPGLFKQVKTISGDREHDLGQLSGRYDAVIDTCGYFPRVVKLSANALKDLSASYVFISSISVFADNKTIGMDENYPVGKIEDETIEEITGESYGPLKALCEKAVQEIYKEHALIVRPGLIVGPHDPTDRFTYWPLRVARGGDVLAPEKPDVPVQIIDVRDLASFIINLIEQKASGIYNATGPAYELTFDAMLQTCKQVSGSDANFKWASVEFLEAQNVAAWSDMPVWVPDNEDFAGFSRMNISKAMKAGLVFRPLAETVKDTLQWAAARAADYQMRAGLSAEREKELLSKL